MTPKTNQPLNIATKGKSAFGFPGKADSRRIIDLFPIPVEIFDSKGTTVYCNRAFMELNGIKDIDLLAGKYNVLGDPVMEKIGLLSSIRSAFCGKTFVMYDVVLPIQDLVNRGLINEKPFKKALTDFHLYPIMKDKEAAFVVFVCVVKKIYTGRPKIARAKEYMDKHLQDEYDPRAVAKSVSMSVAGLYKVFKKNTGMTPGEYHKNIKIERLKKQLADTAMSVKEAFDACGEDSQGRIARVFKRITGLSPTQYRERMKKQRISKVE